MRMRCTAVRDGDDWILNGTKNWITHGISGDVVVVLVRTGELLDSRGNLGFCCGTWYTRDSKAAKKRISWECAPVRLPS